VFHDRHRCQLGVNLVETPGRLRVEPKGFPMQWVAAWLALVFLVILVVLAALTLWREDRMVLLIYIGGAGFIYPGMFGILFAISRAELAKGPLLEVDESRRQVTLLRENRIIKFDDVDSLFLLTGWYDWSDGWEKIAELSLLVRTPENATEQVPVLLHNNVWEMKPLAERLADRLGKPVEQVKLTWKERRSKKAAS